MRQEGKEAHADEAVGAGEAESGPMGEKPGRVERHAGHDARRAKQPPEHALALPAQQEPQRPAGGEPPET